MDSFKFETQFNGVVTLSFVACYEIVWKVLECAQCNNHLRNPDHTVYMWCC
jgi:hypothetical protein